LIGPTNILADSLEYWNILQKHYCYFSKLLGYYICVALFPKLVHLRKTSLASH